MDKELLDENHNDKDGKQVLVSGRITSEYEELLIDFGNWVTKETLTRLIDFNKYMLGLTATFVTLMASFYSIYPGLQKMSINISERIVLIIPVLLMFMSSLSFAVGYMPQKVKMKFQELNTLEHARDKLIQFKRMWSILGFIFFSLSTLSLVYGILSFNFGK